MAELEAADMVPFRKMSAAGMAAVMPTHVVYPQVDSLPAGFSAKWLKSILRKDMGFNGMVFSDDLTMGACVVGGIKDRIHLALAAGCDVVLVCAPELVDELRENFTIPADPELDTYWQGLANTLSLEQACAVMETSEFKAAQAVVAQLAMLKDTDGIKVSDAV